LIISESNWSTEAQATQEATRENHDLYSRWPTHDRLFIYRRQVDLSLFKKKTNMFSSISSLFDDLCVFQQDRAQAPLNFGRVSKSLALLFSFYKDFY
jgi:hypothetical protein